MKKIVAAIFVVILLLAGCTVKNYTPRFPESVNQTAKVTWGDFSYECEICRNLQGVKVTLLNTQAKGLVMNYDGSAITFVYNNQTNTVQIDKSECMNTAIIIYEAFDYITSTASLEVKKVEDGYSYYGKISSGDFIILQNDDNSIKSLCIKSENYKIEFK